MDMTHCMGCRKQAELTSLRAAVKRFEDGREVSNLKTDLKKANRKVNSLKPENDRLKAENHQLRMDNRFYHEQNEDLEQQIEDLSNRFLDMQTRIDVDSLFQSDDFTRKIDRLFLMIMDDMEVLKNIIEEKEAYIAKLKAQIHKDFTNSSKPSSQCPNRKPIPNNRIKTGKKPGGEKGHPGHPRKQLETTEEPVDLPIPDEVAANPAEYEFVGFKSRKQTDIKMKVIVSEVRSAVFRNRITGKEVWTDFPEGYENEINYGPTVKAFCCLANNYLNVPLRKISGFLSDLTGNTIEIAPSTVLNIKREFAKRTKKERSQIFTKLLDSPYMHSDATSIRIDGKLYFVFVSSNGKEVLYQFREHKGDQGLKRTPVENYMFVLIHDHDVTYFKYGGDHQKCVVHEQRYVKGSEDNEPDLEWNTQMAEHLRWIIHNFKEGNLQTEDSIRQAKQRYYEILDLAMKEYAEIPEAKLKYYKEGYNTAVRLKEYGDSILYFLTHPEIPYDNNEAERRARRIKGKLRVIGTFRSFQSAKDYLKFMSYTETNRDTTDNMYEKLVEVFS